MNNADQAQRSPADMLIKSLQKNKDTVKKRKARQQSYRSLSGRVRRHRSAASKLSGIAFRLPGTACPAMPVTVCRKSPSLRRCGFFEQLGSATESLRTSWKMPQNIFRETSLPPLSCRRDWLFRSHRGWRTRERRKRQARNDASAGESLTLGLPAVFLRKELYARGSEERGDSESRLRHAKRRRGGKRDLSGKNLTEKGAVTHHHSSLKFWSG